jgi:hypothetical protein
MFQLPGLEPSPEGMQKTGKMRKVWGKSLDHYLPTEG